MVLVIVGPTFARANAEPRPSADARIVAHDSTSDAPYLWFQDGASPDTADNSVTIAAGGTVQFSFEEGGAPHNVAFPNQQPSSCSQDEDPTLVAAPLPRGPEFPTWNGVCTFNTPGSYRFYCQAHSGMEGFVEVEGTAPTPTPTPTVTFTPTATPTVTATATPTPTGRPLIVAKDGGAQPYWFQDASSSNPDDNSVTIKVGEKVDFAYPTGFNVHNVKFDTNPSSCVQRTGNVRPAPPLPQGVEGPGWSGECTFNTAGTYTFLCSAHLSMTGSVVVEPPPDPPDTTITSGPAPQTNQTTASVTFTSPQSAAAFECKLDTPSGAGSYGPCTSPWSRSALTDGAYTFSVRAVYPAGNPDPTPATRVFTVDTGPPDTTINGGPSGTVNTASASFPFSGTELGVTFECSLDSAVYAPCTSPRAFSALADGAHTFSVRATDLAGNVDPTPASRAFTVDTIAPDTTITSGPSGPTSSSSASFGFSSEANATFECRLDAGEYVACTSPRVLSGLADGAHTLYVRAKDAVGNVDPSPASRAFTVDTTAPDTTINDGPSGTVNTTSPSFQFSGTEVGVTFECRLDTGAYEVCSSPRALTGLSDGAHTFSVRAKDAVGNLDPSPASRMFTVDTAAPNTIIDSGPTGTVNTATPALGFSSSETGSSFECRLDGPGAATGTYALCTSPRTVGPLVDGAYTFSVRATDAAGNVDATPATRTFSVETSLPDTGITAGPSGPTNGTSPSFAFTSTKAGSTFECRLDTPSGAGTFTACTSPQTYTTTANGAYTFLVRAKDAAGNLDATPASQSFTVDTVAPDTAIDAGPSGTVTTSSPSFSFSSEAGAKLECRLDGPGGATGSYGLCTSPRVLGSLADGTYTFLVRATDVANNVDPTPASRTFTVDATAPDTTIDTGPSGAASSPTFTFSASESGSTFECQLDGPGGATGTFAACTSPRTLSPPADGTYTFRVRAKDAAGNVDATAASRSFTVDTTAPDTAIDSGPSGTVTTASPSFSFSSEAGATFECRLDGPGATAGTYASCSSPRVLGSLADGAYTFLVRAKDAAGNVDATPASRTFTVDAAAPDTTIDTGPSGSIATASPSFTFSSNEQGSTFECRLDGPGGATGAYAQCTSPRTLTTLADGAYTLRVRAKDGAGNLDLTPASRTFTVDTTAPDTTITGGSSGIVTGTTQSFTFTGEAGATFECRLDTPSGAGAFSACTAPRAYDVTALGAYTFRVRALDTAGNVDATPATRAFTLQAAPAPMAGTIDARDDGTGNANWFQDASQSSAADSTVSITAGETVRFRAVPPAAGAPQFHNVSFKNSALKPASCDLPGIKPGPWEGTCSFAAPGTYTFLCEIHPATMTGTVEVTAAPQPTVTATPTPVPTFSATPAPTVAPTPSPAPPPKPSASLDAPSKPKLATYLKSGLKLTGPCASLSSGTVTLSVTKAVAKKLKLKGTSLGTGTGRCASGKFSVTVKPSAAVKKALKKHKGAVSATATLKAGSVTSVRKLTLK
ncbi:plastocyanin/azurin family copper-binding protein [Solirubrobacter phytolaccae]|uniref:Plastocyanin/azurin family copper-binding protein n=1 Tax=Solirubrobacter phytolaccae TaxID=1404360 RepID=A0A9X3SGD1_9ACTN|nr:plastocyanin/azurin family copper-binding protein [Solirubrobacter phytolaccae]MDA0182327.1 plastocyanin/azurin family copper-binding protein [Solirubrobacter phytolaccae]